MVDNEEYYYEDQQTPTTPEPEESENEVIQGNNVGIEEKPTIDKFWNPDEILKHLELTWKGGTYVSGEYEIDGSKAKARDEFINSAINSLRSVMNSSNMISKMNEEQVEYLLLEKNLDFDYSMHDEFSISEDDYETMANQFDHALEIFMNIILNGHGAKVLTMIYSGLYKPDDLDNNTKDTFIMNLARSLENKK